MDRLTERRFLRAFPFHGFGPWVDTLKLSRAVWPEKKSFALGDLILELGLEDDLCDALPGFRWHDALSDALPPSFFFGVSLARRVSEPERSRFCCVRMIRVTTGSGPNKSLLRQNRMHARIVGLDGHAFQHLALETDAQRFSRPGWPPATCRKIPFLFPAALR